MGNENKPAAKRQLPEPVTLTTAQGSTERLRAANKRGNASFCKICVVGESGAGKTALVRWLAQNPFDPVHRPTIGVEFKDITLTLDAHAWKLQLWDWAGRAHWRTDAASFFGDAAAVILVVDCTKPGAESIGDAGMWMDQLRHHGSSSAPLILVATKQGLVEPTRLRELKTELIEFMQTHEAHHFIEVECSRVDDADRRAILTEMIVSRLPEAAITRL